MFVLAYNNKGDNKVPVDSFKKYFLQRVKIEHCNIEIDGRNFYDQPINIQLNNTMKSEKYQQDTVINTRLVVY